MCVRFSKGFSAFLSVLSLSLLVGCGTSFDPKLSGSEAAGSFGQVRGSVHGGQQPFVNSQIFLFAANHTGYGQPSISLLNTSTFTLADADISSPTFGDNYVLSGSDGSFTLTGLYQCTPGDQVYVYAYGGRPAGPNIFANTAAGFLAALGQCPAAGTLANALPFIAVNEVTTVAAAYALSGFMTDPVHVSSSGTALAKTGVANAFANVTNLTSISTGFALATTAAGNGIAPQAEVNTLANILAYCVNTNDTTSNPSAGVLSSQCNTLFALTTLDGTTGGTKPGNTAMAALNVAHHPGANIAALFSLAGGVAAPFQPSLASAPADYTVGFQFTGPGIDYPANLAVDANGSVWFINNTSTINKMSSLGAFPFPGTGYAPPNSSCTAPSNSLSIDSGGNSWIACGNVVKFSNSGSLLSPSSGFTGGGLNYGSQIAIDGLGNAWISNSPIVGSAYLSKLSNSGSPLSPGTGFGGGGLTASNAALAIDGTGNAWAATTKLSKFSSSGAALSPSSGYAGAGFGGGPAVAVDASGNIWIPNSYTNSVIKASNAGVTLGTYSGGGLYGPQSVAIDGAGNIWLTNVGNNFGNQYTVTEFANSGAAVSPGPGYGGDYFGVYGSPQSIAIDGSGNAWIASAVSSSGPVARVPMIIELIGTATPVITPIAAGLPSTASANGISNLGTRP